MSDGKTPQAGQIGWIDLTTDAAGDLRDFYASVVGWKPEAVSMGDYDDYNMTDSDGVPKAGVCHRRESNAKQPGCWMVYFTVADLEASMAACRERGGKILAEPRGEGSRFCVIEDPSGTVCSLYGE
jgi:predicted enzyme related to lactoylglutathione lyase